MEETPRSRYSHQPTNRITVRRKSLFMDSESNSPSPKTTSTAKSYGFIAEQELDGIAFLDDNDTSIEEVLRNASVLNAGHTPMKYDNPPQHERSMATPSHADKNLRKTCLTPMKWENTPSSQTKSMTTPLKSKYSKDLPKTTAVTPFEAKSAIDKDLQNTSNTPMRSGNSVATPSHTKSIDQDLPTLLNSMSLEKSKKENQSDKENIGAAKRHMNFSPRKEPPKKVSKVRDSKVSPIDTKNFYSTPRTENPKLKLIQQKKATAPIQTPRIRKRKKTHLKPTSIDNILSTINSDKLRSKILAHREQKQKLSVVHQILMESQNPIAMAMPLNVNTGRDKDVTCDFSDVEEEECVIDEVEIEIIDELPEAAEETSANQDVMLIETEEEPKVEVGTKRKFFKSKDRSKKEFKLVGKMTAEVLDGKMTLKTDAKKSAKKKKVVIRKSDFITKEESDRNKERIQMLKNLYAYEKQYGVDCDFFHKPTEGLWSVLKRMKGGEDFEQSLEERRKNRSPTSRNHSVEKPAAKTKLDKIDPHRKKKVFPHFRLTTGETIVFNEDIGTFHEVETPKNMPTNKYNGTVPDNKRDRAGGKEKKRKKELAKQDKSDAAIQTSDSSESILKLIPDKGYEVVQKSRPVKIDPTPPKKSVSYEDRDVEKPEKDVFWKTGDSSSDDCSSSEDDVLRYRTESECEIQERMFPLMEKYGAAYIAQKIMVIGRKWEEELELMRQKKAARNWSDRSTNQCPRKGILKNFRIEPTTVIEVTPVKCLHCQRKNNMPGCKSESSRPCIKQQRQFRR